MDEIKADYDRLEQVANQFVNQSQAIQQMLQQVQGAMDPLQSGGWMGQGSESFFSEMEGEVLPASVRLQQALEEAGQVTRRIVQTVKQAEEEASSPFRVN